MSALDALCLLVRELQEERFKDASMVFLAGSHVRNEQTAFSDLDLVVLYTSLDFAFRESFVYKGQLIEAFHHDVDTLAYFFEQDARRGKPSLPQLVLEGIVIPQSSPLSEQLKHKAELLLAEPIPLSDEEIVHQRYWISDCIWDLKEPRSRTEAIATGTVLYDVLANFYLRTRGFWGTSGKWLPRSLQRANPVFAEQFHAAFDVLFQTGSGSAVIDLALQAMEPFGGVCFDGYYR